MHHASCNMHDASCGAHSLLHLTARLRACIAGAVHAGQSRDQFVAEEPELTEDNVPLATLPPLVGDQKVEFMLGVTKPPKRGAHVQGNLPNAKRLRK
jgi:hypothetical protein